MLRPHLLRFPHYSSSLQISFVSFQSSISIPLSLQGINFNSTFSPKHSVSSLLSTSLSLNAHIPTVSKQYQSRWQKNTASYYHLAVSLCMCVILNLFSERTVFYFCFLILKNRLIIY